MSTGSDSPPTREERFKDAARAAKKRIPGRAPTSPAVEMQEIASAIGTLAEPEEWDRYVESGPVAVLEHEVTELLGKPAAAMFPSGIMAQQALLRVWTDRQSSRRVALPGLSHLLHHELDGPQLLHGLRYERLTAGAQVPTIADLSAIGGPLGAVLLELPLRAAGYRLPGWDDLARLAEGCSERGVPLHFDGARLWESAPYLGHSLAEIAALADSVYVSLYKGLGGMAGALVAGPEDVVDEARQWRRRLGGTLFSMLPYAVSGLRGLRDELPRMGEYHERAKDLARQLPSRGVTVDPELPQTNAFRLLVPVEVSELMERLVGFMTHEGVVVSAPWVAADVPGWSETEFTVGPATMEWGVAESVDLLAKALFG